VLTPIFLIVCVAVLSISAPAISANSENSPSDSIDKYLEAKGSFSVLGSTCTLSIHSKRFGFTLYLFLEFLAAPHSTADNLQTVRRIFQSQNGSVIW